MSEERPDWVAERTTGSPEETRVLGRRLAGQLGPGAVVALSGPLGAGKTQLVKGLADGMGLDGDRVTSPTFTVVHEYRGETAVLYHVDAYRIRTEREAAELGIEDILYGEGICVVEWPERIARPLPTDALPVDIRHAGESARIVRLGQGWSVES